MASVGDYFMVYTIKNGSDWDVRYRTSTDGITWTGETTPTITFDSADAIVSTDERRNPHLHQEPSSGEMWLLLEIVESVVDSVEISNIFYTTSSDQGATWAEAIRLTNYTNVLAVAEHPTTTQKSATSMHIAYDEVTQARTMDSSATGWCSSPSQLSPTNMHWDATADRWYVTVSYADGGTKVFYGVIEVDLDTWAITDCWNTSSSPAFNILYDSANVWWNTFWSERPNVIIGTHGGDVPTYPIIARLDYVADTITQYNFATWTLKGLTKNVTFTANLPGVRNLVATHVDEDNDRLWISWSGANAAFWSYIQIGYIALSDVGPDYTYTTIVYDNSGRGLYDSYKGPDGGGVMVHPDYGWVSHTEYGVDGSFFGDQEFKIYSDTDVYAGTPIFHYKQSTHSGFPGYGLRTGYLITSVGGETVLYGGFSYTTNFSQSSNRGLLKITFSTDSFDYIRPTTSTEDEYGICNVIQLDSNHIAMSTLSNGIYIMNVNDESWTVINNTNTPGLTESGVDTMVRQLTYDPLRGFLLSGVQFNGGGWTGLSAVSRFGPTRKSQYLLGSKAGSWSFATAADLVRGSNDFNAAVEATPTGNGLFAFWVNRTFLDKSIKWDLELGSLNLDPYISREHEISMKRSIDGSPSKLDFTVTHGHLFDIHNINSVLSGTLAKLKKITLRFGEISADVNYWQNQGTFIVMETSVSYERGTYPVLTVNCEDKMSTWDDQTILATDNYTAADPNTVLDDIVKTNTDFVTSTIDVPTLNNKTDVYIQWLDTTTLDIVRQLLNRFGYFPRIDVDGKFSAKEISNTAAISQTYTDATAIINFTPDDTFSDYTNQVTVTGEEADFTSTIFAEERIQTLNGTTGWWGGYETFIVYYSPDKSRTCRNPRLEVLYSTTSLAFKILDLIGFPVTEGLEATDPDEHWVETFISIPNLSGLLGAAISLMISAIWLPNKVPVHSLGVHLTINVGRAIFGAGAASALKVLQAVVNWQHEIHAQPVGKVRRSVQSIANDTEMQTSMGYVVNQKIDDPLCYTVSQCQFVAEFEIMLAQLQRKRVKFTKVANMIDEEGDTIQIIHPHSGSPLKVFITELVRKMKINNGYFIDEIEGWVIE